MRERLIRFLQSTDPTVICLRGKWGTGKTYTWNDCLDQTIKDKTISHHNYSYVSLFGVDNLKHLKNSILENTVSTDIVGNEPTIKSVTQLLKDASPSESFRAFKGFGASFARQSLTSVSNAKIPWVSQIADAAAPAAFLIVRNQIICIDDLERRGKNLSVSDVMGLTSYLKERRGCKIALLLNDDQLGDYKDDFLAHLEKVCDVSILYSPTSEEACRIVLEDTESNQTVGQAVAKLQITNIRVIRRISAFAAELSEILAGYDARIVLSTITSLVVLGWSEFMSREAPPLEFLMGRATMAAKIVASMNKQPLNFSKQEQEWVDRLEAIGWDHASAMDEELQRSLARGYFVPERIIALAGPIAESQAKADELDKYHAAWRLYHDHLTDNSAALIDAFEGAVRTGSKQISLNNFGATISILKALDQQALATNLIQIYVEAYVDTPEFFEMRAGDPSHFTEEPEVVAAFQARSAQNPDDRSLRDILLAVAGRYWWPQNFERISQAGADEVYAALLSLSGDKPGETIKDLVTLKDHGEPLAREAWVIIRTALERLANDSAVNRLRFRRYDLRDADSTQRR